AVMRCGWTCSRADDGWTAPRPPHRRGAGWAGCGPASHGAAAPSPNVALSLGRFVGGRPVVVVWVVEDGEWWGQQEAILITTGSGCPLNGAGGEEEAPREGGGGGG